MEQDTNNESNVIYVYDGTLDGLLSAIFEAFLKKENPLLITKNHEPQMMLGASIREIVTSEENSSRVLRGISEKLGEEILRAVWYCSLSEEEDAGVAVLRFLRLGFKLGEGVYADLTNPIVFRMKKIYSNVERESARYLEFIRFSELEGGILFAEFEPLPHVLPLIMPHFADRLNTEAFIIYDKGRRLAGVYDKNQWMLVSAEDMKLPDYSEDEIEYRSMWRMFYETIAIKERINDKLRMKNMPKKYWQYLTEMQ